MGTKTLKGLHNTSSKLMKDGAVSCSTKFFYNLLEFDGAMVDMDFIINSLSKHARYTGHNQHEFAYSVAQHSVMMAQAALLAHGDVQLAWDCLFHDAGEAFTGDIIKPLKNILGAKFADIEENLETIIFEELKVVFPFDPRVKEIDVNICVFELSVMMDADDYHLFDVWSAKKSQQEFNNMVRSLGIMFEYDKKELVKKK